MAYPTVGSLPAPDAQPRREPAAPPRQLSDPRAMRALAHPTRLALWEALTVHGELTATQAAEYVGESPSSCSFHLRQLAKYGFVTDAGDGSGRSRPWRVTHLGFVLAGDAPGAGAAAGVLAATVLQRQVERHLRWQRAIGARPGPWRDVGVSAESIWWITPGEAAGLEQTLTELVYRFRDRLADPGARPADSRPVEFVALMHLFEPPAAEPGR